MLEAWGRTEKAVSCIVTKMVEPGFWGGLEIVKMIGEGEGQ